MNGTFLGFDFGLRRIGVAVGQVITCGSNPLTTLTSQGNNPDWMAIKLLIDEWQPEGLVVGIPVHMDGKETAITQRAQQFARQLAGRFNLPVHSADERLSSREAESIIKHNRQSGRRNKSTKKDVDKIAATLILQTWLENHANSR